MNQDQFFNPFKGNAPFNLTKFASVGSLKNVHPRKPNKEGYLIGPAIDLEDIVLLPQSLAPLVLNNLELLHFLQETYEQNQTIFGLFTDPASPTEDPLFLDIAVEMAIASIIELDSDRYSVLFQVLRRVEFADIAVDGDQVYLKALPIKHRYRRTEHLTALKRLVIEQFERYVDLVEFISEDVFNYIQDTEDPGDLADFIVSTLDLPYATRVAFLKETNGVERLNMLLRTLTSEINILKLEEDINNQVQSELDRSQREIYIREQISTLQKELNDGKPVDPAWQELSERIEKTPLSPEAKEAATKELDHLAGISSLSPESSMIESYIEWLLDLPWTTETTDNLDINHAQQVLDQNHYGLKKAKDRILEYLAVRSLKPKVSRQPILCFVGPPGTGKTSLGKSIAEALERNFVRVSLGGVHDEAEIRGHRRTYLGALPGRILQTMRKAKTINPVFMLDEIDKLNADFQGDPSAALLEVLDPEQNYTFSDHYLEVPYDLSKVLFITTANTVASIPPALLDRMEVIEFPGYIEEEKIAIANQFLIPKQLLENGLDEEAIHFTPEALHLIIEGYTYEAGVRNLEREIGTVLRKIARLKSEGKPLPKEILPEQISDFLGPQEFYPTVAEQVDEIGMATAIAWTENGGEIMPIEVLVIDGKGNLQITGQIGDIMQESAQAALSYLKSKAKIFQIPEGFFEDVDLHIHVPEGAIAKDGPSAGITIATALTSAVLGVPVKHDVAMTGEITLRGRVLPVGGIREKVLAAHRAGIKTVLLPRKNEKDLAEIPPTVLKELNLVPVDHMDQVLAQALADQPINKQTKPPSGKAKRKSAPSVEEAPE
ncbi:MAG TPA: endopeptidase La [Anaerolineaceae bacterium]|nr:endopeptidase La [Anaerolineaceae bacterium]